MKARRGNVILLFVFITMVTGRHPARDYSKLLEHLHINPGTSKSVIIVVNAKTVDQEVKNLNGEDNFSSDDASMYDDEAKEQAKQLLYDYLLRSGDPQNTEEEHEDEKKMALRAALRARCKAVIKCKRKCKKTRAKKYCPQNCKAVFDKLGLCDPPKKKNLCDEDSEECTKSSSSSKENECGKNSSGSDECNGKRKKGKTMPPKWNLRYITN